MADTNATYNTSVTADFPDYASSTVKFTNEAFFISGNSEILAGKQYTLTIDANGQGTQLLPCPDNTGDAAVTWLITLPSKESERYAIAYSATPQQLSDILAAGSTTTDPDDITAALASKANKVNGGTADNIVTLTADGDIQDGGTALATVTSHISNTSNPHSVTINQVAAQINTVATSGASQTLGNTYTVHIVTLTANCSFTIAAPANTYNRLRLRTIQGTGGGFTISFTNTITYDYGIAPVPLTAEANITDYVLETLDGGTTWRLAMVADGVSS